VDRREDSISSSDAIDTVMESKLSTLDDDFIEVGPATSLDIADWDPDSLLSGSLVIMIWSLFANFTKVCSRLIVETMVVSTNDFSSRSVSGFQKKYNSK